MDQGIIAKCKKLFRHIVLCQVGKFNLYHIIIYLYYFLFVFRSFINIHFFTGAT